jgi:drug/metabolite transporter (DMT)-like permease
LNKKLLFAHLAILGANLIYAINYGFAKDVMNGGYVPPFTFILFRGIGATFLFWITSFFFMRKYLSLTYLNLHFAVCLE